VVVHDQDLNIKLSL